VIVNKISEPFSVKVIVSHEKESKHFFPIMWNRNTFFHKNNTLTTQIQQRNIFFLASDSINFFFSYNAKSEFFFRSARALKYVFLKKIPAPSPQITKWLLP
jgi:hypothetical protein